MLKDLPEFITKRILKDSMVLKKKTVTVIEDEYEQATSTYTDYNIKGTVQPITLEDLTYLPAGKLKAGDARGFFLPSYVIGVITVSVEVDDRIVYNGITWRVQEIIDHYQGIKHREAYLVRVTGE